MTTYYVRTSSSGGSDSNNGLATGSAWATINHAVDSVSAGDVIKVLSGTYNECVRIVADEGDPSGSSGSPIVLEAYDLNNRPIIKSNRTNSDASGYYYCIEIANRSYWVINGFKFQDLTQAGAVRITADDASISDITIQYCHAENIKMAYVNNSDRYIMLAKTYHGEGPNVPRDAFAYRIHFLDCTIYDTQSGTPSGYHETLTLNGQLRNSSVQGCRIEKGSYIAFDIKGSVGDNNDRGSYGYGENILVRDNTVIDVKVPGTNRNAIYVDRGGKTTLPCGRKCRVQWQQGHSFWVRNGVEC